ncbi:MAG: sugar transferase [Betaproteobacteria bacterium]
MAGNPAPDNREPAMADIHLLPRRIALSLLLTDLMGLILAFNLANWLRLGAFLGLPLDMLLPIAVLVLALYVLDCYSVEIQVAGMRAAPRTLVAVLLGAIVTAAAVYASGLWGSGNSTVGRGVMAVALLIFAAWAPVWRHYASRYQRQQTGKARWLVAGTSEKALRLYRDFQKANAEAELSFLADSSANHDNTLPRVVGTLEDLETVLEQDWSGVIVAPLSPLSEGLIQKLMKARFSGLRVYDLADFYEQRWFKVPVMHTQRGWLLFAHGFDLLHNALALRLKRLLDIVVSVILLIVCIPVMLIVAIAVRLESHGPAWFRQTRTGLNGKEFEIMKFRSMYVNAENDGPKWASARDPRVTKVGRLLRILRLDELPQLLNVIKGEMSFIGPRPERPVFIRELEKQIPFYDLRQLVRPGITGWAQVMYSYGATMDDALEKLQYDLYYIKNYSLLLDFAILLKTLGVVMLGRGR